MRLSGSVKFFCALGSGSSDGGRRACPVSCGPRLVAAPRPALWPWPPRPLRSASNSAFAARIFSTRFFLSATHLGSSSPLLSRPKALSPRRPQPRLRSATARPRPPARRTLLHALVAHRLVLGGVRLDLRPVERDMAELHKSRLFAQLENLPDIRKRLQVPLAEVGDGANRGSSPTMLRKSTRSRAALRSGATSRRRCNSRTATAPSSSPVKRRLPALARIRGFDLTKVERLEHKRQNEASQMVLATKS